MRLGWMVQSQNSPSPQQAGTALRSGRGARPPRPTPPGLQGALRPPPGLLRWPRLGSLVRSSATRGEPGCGRVCPPTRACSGRLSPDNPEDSRLAERMAAYSAPGPGRVGPGLVRAGGSPTSQHPGASHPTPSPLGTREPRQVPHRSSEPPWSFSKLIKVQGKSQPCVLTPSFSPGFF